MPPPCALSLFVVVGTEGAGAKEVTGGKKCT